MPFHQHRRNVGQCLLYDISYDWGEYFISRDGQLKKSVPDAHVAGVVQSEATPELMLRMAIADIEVRLGSARSASTICAISPPNLPTVSGQSCHVPSAFSARQQRST